MSKKLKLIGPDQVGSIYATADSYKKVVLKGMVEQASYQLFGYEPTTNKEKHCLINIKVFMPLTMTTEKELVSIKKFFIRRVNEAGWKGVEIKFTDYKKGVGSFEIDFLR